MFAQGMNFEAMWSVQHNSDLLFWEIAIPMMIVVITIFFWSEFGRMFERLEKRLQRKKIDKVISPFSLYPRLITDIRKSQAQTGLDTLHWPLILFADCFPGLRTLY